MVKFKLSESNFPQGHKSADFYMYMCVPNLENFSIRRLMRKLKLQ